jgi:hypothetical protein
MRDGRDSTAIRAIHIHDFYISFYIFCHDTNRHRDDPEVQKKCQTALAVISDSDADNEATPRADRFARKWPQLSSEGQTKNGVDLSRRKDT